MRKDQSSYVNVRALSHASLQKFRHSVNQPKPQFHPKQILFNSKPNIKYYSNSNEHGSTIVASKKSQVNSKSEQQLKKNIKVLEYELKKKINDHCYLVKLFKTKTNSQLSHIDLYVEFNNLEQELQSKNTKIKQLEQKLEQTSKEVEALLTAKNEHEGIHTKQVTSFIDTLDKLQKKHSIQLMERQNQLIKEKRTVEEKDCLLKQIKRKYEQSQSLLMSLENQLMQVKSSKRQIEKAYEQRIQNTRQDFLIRVQQSNRQLQKYTLRIRQQEQIIKQLKQQTNNKQSEKSKSLKKMQAQLSSKQKQLNQLTGRLSSAEHELSSLYEQKESYEERERGLIEQLDGLRNQMKAQENNYQKELQKVKKQIDNNKMSEKQYLAKHEKFEKQLGKLQEKLAQANSTIKVLHFQKQDKQIAVQKLKQTLTHKQQLIQQKQHSIQTLESKLHTLQRKSATSQQRIKELQKQLLTNKQSGAYHTKAQIENYKCIGRLTELIHQIQLTISQAGYKDDQRQHANVGKMKMNNTRTRVKTVESEELETVTQCVDILTKQLQIFMKKLYPQTLTQTKQTKELVQQIICDIKSIFHAYNSYVQDQQLKGATRQYLQCLDSHEKSMRKSRNNYLQVIMERLISIIAIQSYTSENGLTRQNQSKAKFSRKMHMDSLENTGSRWDENQENIHKIYIDERPVLRQQRRKTNEQTQNRYIRNDSKKKLHKLSTQPCQIQNLAMRKLDYGKENYMHRINISKPQTTQEINSRYSSLAQQSSYMNKYYGDNGRKIPAVKRSQIDSDQIMKQMRKDRKTIISEADIEKKYFR